MGFSFLKVIFKNYIYFEAQSNNSTHMSIVVSVSSSSGLSSTKSMDLINLVSRKYFSRALTSSMDKPSSTGVPVPGTYCGSKQSMSKLK